MIEKEAELSRQRQREIDLQIGKQLQIEENAGAARLERDEIKQSQMAEMNRLMEVINKKNSKTRGNLMNVIPQPCPCCNVEKHQATASSCIKAAKTTQETTQERFKKHHPLCMCEICDEEITKEKQEGNNWSTQKGPHKKENELDTHKHDPSPKGQESITSTITQSESEESFPELSPPSDPGDEPQWPGFTDKTKKYHFSGTV